MDKRFHLRAIALFTRLVETGGFSPAAASLGLSKATASREIAELERELGAKLVHRSTRRVELTELGRSYYRHCKRIMAEAETAEAMIARHQTEPVGMLRCTAPSTFGTVMVVPVVSQLRRDFPHLEVDLDLTDRPVDLASGNVDLSIIVTSTPPEHVVARRLATIDWVFCAAPHYLAAHAQIREPADLEQHDFLLYRNQLPGELTLKRGRERVEIALGSRFKTNSSLALLQAVEEGLGVACLPRYVVGDALETGRAVTLLQDWTIPPRHAFAVYLPNRFLLPRVRVFIDRLVASLREPVAPA